MEKEDLKKFLNISIHASRGGSDQYGDGAWLHPCISIHASRGGSDKGSLSEEEKKAIISIHASRGGSDLHFVVTF